VASFAIGARKESISTGDGGKRTLQQVFTRRREEGKCDKVFKRVKDTLGHPSAPAG